MSSPFFGIFFVGHSYPVFEQHFTRVDPTHWVLDVSVAVTPEFTNLKEVSLFLTQPNSLDPQYALGLYVRSGQSEWLYRGYVHNTHPSEVMPLQWPSGGGGGGGVGADSSAGGGAQLGVSLEPLAEALGKEGSKLGAKADFARRVGMHLYRFLESFHTSQQYGDNILIPTNALDKWLRSFNDKFRRDPEFLTRNAEQF